MTAWGEMKLVERMWSRQQEAEAARNYYESDWADCIDLAAPEMSGLSWDADAEGGRRGLEIYDYTAVHAADTWVNGMTGHLVSPSLRWFQFSMADRRLRDSDRVRDWLQGCEEQVYFRYNSSNFYSAMNPHFKNEAIVGNSNLLMQDDVGERDIIFSAPHVRENYFIRDKYGRISGYHRRFELTARQAREMFKSDLDAEEGYNKRFSEALKQAIRSGRYSDRFEFIWAVYPKEDPIFDGVSGGVPNRPWRAFYFEYSPSSELQKEKPLLSEGFFTQPFAPWRYFVNSNEVYGRGPTQAALVAIYAVNKITMNIGAYAEQVGNPTMVSPLELRGKVARLPGGHTYIDAPEQSQMLRPQYDMRAWPFGMEWYSVQANAVRDFYHVRLFLLMNEFIDQGTPTATQVMETVGERAQLMGPLIKRLENECLSAVMGRVFDIEYRGGRLPEPPPEVMDISAGEPTIHVKYIGPLAQAAKRLFATRQLHDSIAKIGPIFQLAPQTINKVRWDKWVEAALEEDNVPQDLIVGQEEYDAAIEEMNRRAAAAEMADAGLKMSQAVKNVAGPVDQTSPLASLA